MAPLAGSSRDHYVQLEVQRSADAGTIAASYRRLARLKHPDKNRDNPNATAEFQALQEAYTVLKDEEKRFAYDRRLLLRKATTAPASASAFAPAPAPASGSAAAAATAAVAEALRRKQKQQQQQRQQPGGGLFSSYANPPWDPARDAPRTTPPEPAPPPPPQSQTRRKGGGGGGGAGRTAPSPSEGRSYPPSPPNKPTWPATPPGKDDALEEQIRSLRKEIRGEDKAIARLMKKNKEAENQITTCWQMVSQVDSLIAEAALKEAKLSQPSITQEWFDGLFGPGPPTPPRPPRQKTQQTPRTQKASERPSSPSKTAERLVKLAKTQDMLKKKLAQVHVDLGEAMAGSRSTAAEIQEATKRKAEKEAVLHQLCLRWRRHEFGGGVSGGDSNGDGDGTQQDTDDSGWDGWCGWDEGEIEGEVEVGADSDDEEQESSRWWDSNNDESLDNIFADHGASFSFVPTADIWAPGTATAAGSIPYCGMVPDYGQGMEGSFVGGQYSELHDQSGQSAGQYEHLGHLENFGHFGQFEQFEQYQQYEVGQHGTGYCEEYADDEGGEKAGYEAGYETGYEAEEGYFEGKGGQDSVRVPQASEASEASEAASASRGTDQPQSTIRIDEPPSRRDGHVNVWTDEFDADLHDFGRGEGEGEEGGNPVSMPTETAAATTTTTTTTSTTTAATTMNGWWPDRELCERSTRFYAQQDQSWRQAMWHEW